mgnify:CR=1 FL=1
MKLGKMTFSFVCLFERNMQEIRGKNEEISRKYEGIYEKYEEISIKYEEIREKYEENEKNTKKCVGNMKYVDNKKKLSNSSSHNTWALGLG